MRFNGLSCNIFRKFYGKAPPKELQSVSIYGQNILQKILWHSSHYNWFISTFTNHYEMDIYCSSVASPDCGHKNSHIWKIIVLWTCITRDNPSKAEYLLLNIVRTQALEIMSYKSNINDVIKWAHFPRLWPFVWGIHRSPAWDATVPIMTSRECIAKQCTVKNGNNLLSGR